MYEDLVAELQALRDHVRGSWAGSRQAFDAHSGADMAALSTATAQLRDTRQTAESIGASLSRTFLHTSPTFALPASLHEDLTRANELVQILQDDVAALQAQLASTSNHLGQLPQRLADDGTQAFAHLNNVGATWTTALEAWRESLEDSVAQALEDFETDVGELHSKVLETLEEELENAPEAFIAESEQEFAELLSDHDERLRGAANHLADRCSDALEGLSEHAQQAIQREIEERMRHVLEDVIEALAKDALESTVLTQVAMATTTALSPVLPQLIAARIALGPIKSALDAMRMGT
jgi:hypothetical protein